MKLIKNSLFEAKKLECQKQPDLHETSLSFWEFNLNKKHKLNLKIIKPAGDLGNNFNKLECLKTLSFLRYTVLCIESKIYFKN